MSSFRSLPFRSRAGALLMLTLSSLFVACAGDRSGPIELGPDAQKQALRALIEAEPGDVVEFGPGRFSFDTTLSLDVAGVTIRGAGMDETILDFSSQAAGTGGEGLMVTADDFVIEDLSVYNTRADGIKVEGTRNATFRRVFVNWEGEPRTENGAYGLYPVQVENVLIEDSKVRGCSDAGIYVGQSNNIVVRRNETWENVAGIEIENSTHADIYGNRTWGNTGGILVFSLPELPLKAGRSARIFDNEIVGNNLANFGLPGAIVSEIPAGSGLIIMATDHTEIFDNVFRDNKTSHVAILSFTSTGREYDDPDFEPFAEGIAVYRNTFENGGYAPEGAFAQAAADLLGEGMPDVVYDGVVHPDRVSEGASDGEGRGEVPAEYRVYFDGQGTVASLDLGALARGETPSPVTDAAAFAGTLPEPVSPVVIEIADESVPSA